MEIPGHAESGNGGGKPSHGPGKNAADAEPAESRQKSTCRFFYQSTMQGKGSLHDVKLNCSKSQAGDMSSLPLDVAKSFVVSYGNGAGNRRGIGAGVFDVRYQVM